jgi:hypothetical protein
MTLQALPGPTRFSLIPFERVTGQWATIVNLSNLQTLDAAAEKFAFVGEIRICGGAASKTFSSSGGKIHFKCGSSTTFANASSALDVGIQDTTQASAGKQPDGTFDVKDTLVGGTDTLTSSAINTATMSTGSKTITDGMSLAVVFDLTARGGADSVKIGAANGGNAAFLSSTQSNLAGTWGVTGNASSAPQDVLLETDDGTFCVFEGGHWAPAADTYHSITSASNPDEYGCRFVLPFAATLWGVELPMQSNAGAASGTTGVIYLCSGAAASPSVVTSHNVDGFEVFTTSLHGYRSVHRLATAQNLSASTTYYVSFRATSTQTWKLACLHYPAAGQLAVLPLGTNAYTVTREGSADGTGAFTEVTTDLLPITLLLSKFSDNKSGRANYALGI